MIRSIRNHCSLEEETRNAGNDMDGFELIVKYSDAIRKTQKAHTKHIQSPINIRTDSSFNHRYIYAWNCSKRQTLHQSDLPSLLLFGTRFPSWWSIAGGISWSDDKAGASVARHPLHFPKRRERKIGHYNYILPNASPLCCKALSRDRNCKAEEHDPNANSGHKSVSLYTSSGPPNNRDGQSVDSVGVVMCGNRLPRWIVRLMG